MSHGKDYFPSTNAPSTRTQRSNLLLMIFLGALILILSFATLHQHREKERYMKMMRSIESLSPLLNGEPKAQLLNMKEHLLTPRGKRSQQTEIVYNELLRCLTETPIEKLPSIDHQTDKNCFNGGNSMAIRRQNMLSRAVYCLSRRQDVQSALDVYLGDGGIALMMAHGLNGRGKVFGFEMHEGRCNTVKKLLSPYRSTARPICGATHSSPGSTLKYADGSLTHRELINDDVNGKNQIVATQSAIYDLCKSNTPVDLVFADVSNPKIGRYDTLEGDSLHNQDYVVALSVCRPKFVCMNNLESYYETNLALERQLQSLGWERLVEGELYGIACGEYQDRKRRWTCFMRV